jgi:hypothetical protein
MNWKYLPIEKPDNESTIWVVLNSIYGYPFQVTWYDGNPSYVVSESGLTYNAYEIVKWKYV